MRAYRDIWLEQNTICEQAVAHTPVHPRRQPGFLSPLRLFDHYPSRFLLSGTRVRIMEGSSSEDLVNVRRLQMWGFARGWRSPDQELLVSWRHLEKLGNKGLAVSEWAKLNDCSESHALSQAASMPKVGVLELPDTELL